MGIGKKHENSYTLVSYLCPVSLYKKGNSFKIISSSNKSNRLTLDLSGISSLLCILQDNFEVGQVNNENH